MRIATLDFISNTCFSLLAADELGLFEAGGLDVSLELNLRGVQALRSGACDVLANGSLFGMLKAFPGWKGAKLVVALSQGTPWLRVVRADLAAKQGDLSAIKSLRLIAGEPPAHALKQMATRAGSVPNRDFELIVDMVGARGRDVSFGVSAARALKAGEFEGFWGNALAAEAAVERGAGKVLIDIRRGDDPDDVRHYSFAGMAATDAYLERTRRESRPRSGPLSRYRACCAPIHHSRRRSGTAGFHRIPRRLLCGSSAMSLPARTSGL